MTIAHKKQTHSNVQTHTPWKDSEKKKEFYIFFFGIDEIICIEGMVIGHIARYIKINREGEKFATDNFFITSILIAVNPDAVQRWNTLFWNNIEFV